MKSYIIHFIRHGAIDETLSGKYIGTTDVPLSNKGKMDLKKLDYEYRYPGTQVVFTSPLKRCTETCRILYPEQNPLSIANLSECNFGEWEGKTAEELKNDPDFEKWLAGDNSVKPPRGESNADFTRRICRMFESIVEGLMKTGTTESVIVTHGGVIMTLLAVYGLPQAKPFEWTMDNGFGYSLRVTPMLWQRDKVCEVFQTIPMEKE
ncbi:histidine phosphatase family protein [Ruminococcus sp.]|uniref:histidine phosphatase family protein n=1 Tax=Ruminococcus sp. TaxID=41978 RepID=UPI0025F400C9|nr:histidine phosphatase family protein [Ruminococcus sp.]MCI6616253.1 histidine phosphatase family protein [Ruminococcus sp.]